MAKRLFYRQREDGSSVELVALDQSDAFKIRIDRPGVAAVSIDLPLSDVQEISDHAWHHHEETTPAAPPVAEKSFGGTAPDDA